MDKIPKCTASPGPNVIPPDCFNLREDEARRHKDDPLNGLETLARLRDQVLAEHSATCWAVNDIKVAIHSHRDPRGSVLALTVNGKTTMRPIDLKGTVNSVDRSMGPAYIRAVLTEELTSAIVLAVTAGLRETVGKEVEKIVLNNVFGGSQDIGDPL